MKLFSPTERINSRRLKPKNKQNVEGAIADHSLKMMFNSDLVSISSKSVFMGVDGEKKELENDLVYIFAGGELPTQFLQNAGIEISKRFGHIVKKHS